jgi:hypothetical protein
MKEDDDDIQDYVSSLGWRKREIQKVKELNLEFDRLYAIHRRNEVLEEVAKEIEKMTAFGDTAASFAIFVRNMKR